MAKQILPNNKNWKQPNDGDSFGNVFASYGVDFYENRGRVRASRTLKMVFDQDDDADFDSYPAVILPYKDKYYAVGDAVFSSPASGQITVDGSWQKNTTSGTPSPGNTVTDADVFDGFLFVRDSDDIKRWNGSAWVNWWKTTRGQSSLKIGARGFIHTATDGNLYITDGSATLEVNLLYKVLSNGNSTGAISLSGDGTLDFSATDYQFKCIESTSTRMWIGFSRPNGEGGIIEWDMSPTSSTANKIHELESATLCIAIWQDTPIAVMQNGKVKSFNGVQFIDIPGVQLPKIFERYNEDIIHPNGWDIIDGLPHFLISGEQESAVTGYDDKTQTPWYFPSAVYCLDPDVGIYPRFPLTNGLATEDDISQPTVNAVGALMAINSQDAYAASFFAGYEVFDETVASHAILAYADRDNTRDAKGFIAFQPVEARDGYKNIELIHKKLDSDNKMRVFFRQEEQDPVYARGVWFSTTQFNTTSSVAGVSAGMVAWVKSGKGAGQFLRVLSVDDTGTVNQIIFSDANTFVTQNDETTLEFINFKFMGEVTGTTLDHHTFTIPSYSLSRKIMFLIEFTQLATTKNELDYVIVET